MDPLACLLSFGLVCAPAEAPASEPAVAPADSPAPPASEAGADEGVAPRVLAKVQTYYDATDDLKTQFTQTYVHQVYGTKTISKGTLKLKKPGMMIWDYAQDSDPDFYADGSKLWVVERDTRQVVTKDVADSDFAGAVKFLFGGERLIREFWVRMAAPKLVQRYGIAGHDVVELMPKKQTSHYKRLVLVVDSDSGRVDAFVVLNGDDSTNHFVFTGVSRNPGLKASEFKFKPPPGFVIVRE